MSEHRDASVDLAADFRRKIVRPEDLRSRLKELRDEALISGRPIRVVQCHGCFDIVHPGHIRYLQFARSQGDVLVVSITGDAGIDKEPQRPYIPEELRAENLAALELVDYVVVDSHPTAKALLGVIQPDVYVKGHEYATSDDPGFLAERAVVESYGGRVIFSSGQVVFSSSRLAASMTPWDDLATQRMCLICRRHEIDEPALSGFLDRIAGCRVLVFGDLVVDRYVLCDAGGIAGESPMMSLKSLDQRDYLGGAAAMADQAAALGAEPVLYTAMADDEISHWARTTLESRGTEVRVIHRRPDLPIRTRFLVDDQKLFKVERTASRPLDSVGERQAAAKLAEQANRADAIIFYDSGFGMITPWILGQLDAACRQAAPSVTGGITDAQGNLAAMKRLDLLCTSERRLRAAMNDLDSGLSTLAYRMLDVTQAGRMLVTLGKRGLVTFERPSSDRASLEWRGRLLSEYLPTFAHRVVDRLGCGQALMTTATLASAVGAGLMQGAYLGSLAAAVQLGRLGPDAVSAGDMRRLMRQRAELVSTAEAESHSMRRSALAAPRAGPSPAPV